MLTEREIIREPRDSGDQTANLIIGIVVAILIGVIIYFIANGRFGFSGVMNNTVPTGTVLTGGNSMTTSGY